MDFFKKALSSIGIGAAKVDAIVKNNEYHAGDTVEGVFHLEGGNVAQAIDYINIEVYTKVEKDADDSTVYRDYLLQKTSLPLNTTIQEEEEKDVPFSFQLDPLVPVSHGHFPVWFRTALDIKMAVDPTDSDPLDVEPHPHFGAILDALHNLGFQMRSVKNEPFRKSRLGFIQNVELYPTGPFRSDLDELEVALLEVLDDGIQLWIEVDTRGKGIGGMFTEMLDTDEVEGIVQFTTSELNDQDSLQRQLTTIIQDVVNQ